MKGKKAEKGPGFGDEMIADMRSLVDAIRSGEPLERRFTARTVELDLKPRAYGPEDVKAVRAKLGASQALLARFLGVNVQTLQKWEQGTRKVPAMAARYLDDVQEFPDLWTRRLRSAAE
jgi:DNA-binding transcriptional regulator YiaG